MSRLLFKRFATDAARALLAPSTSSRYSLQRYGNAQHMPSFQFEIVYLNCFARAADPRSGDAQNLSCIAICLKQNPWETRQFL